MLRKLWILFCMLCFVMSAIYSYTEHSWAWGFNLAMWGVNLRDTIIINHMDR